MGCPKLTAPPWTFVLLGSIFRDLRNANTTTLNASFTSHSATSSCFTPHLSSSCNRTILIKQNASDVDHQLTTVNTFHLAVGADSAVQIWSSRQLYPSTACIWVLLPLLLHCLQLLLLLHSIGNYKNHLISLALFCSNCKQFLYWYSPTQTRELLSVQ